MEINSVEILGYVGSVFIGVSITMQSVVKLRIINGIGGILVGIYGLLIHSVPVAALNLFIGAANMYYLWKIFKARKELEKASENSEEVL